ncbi:adenosine receptor A3-like [Orbicella faveolata]|uniref:adenosine receptor A3-like n=1 Tax=Orbicella faveolata TaxID=48498 RepID=UPI0009E26CC2|nr:adenosine receptor A3-like [Orbicella faveolata]
MENFTSHQVISTAALTLNDWRSSQTYQDQLPAFITGSLVINSVLNSLLSLATIIANILILLSLNRTSRVHAASKALYLSLAVSDLGVGLFVQPAFVGFLATGGTKPEICRFLGIIVNVASVISVGVSLQILTAISVDRVLAIRLKMRYKEVASLFRTRLVLVACWFFSTFHALMIFVSREFFDLIQIVGIIMCIGVSTVSYIIISRTLRRLQSQVQNYGPEEETAQNTFNINRYKNSVATALWVYGSLLACYLPFMLSVAVKIAVGRSQTFIGAQWFTVTLIYTNSTLNPILYCWKIQEVRESVKEIIKQYCPCRK